MKQFFTKFESNLENIENGILNIENFCLSDFEESKNENIKFYRDFCKFYGSELIEDFEKFAYILSL